MIQRTMCGRYQWHPSLELYFSSFLCLNFEVSLLLWSFHQEWLEVLYFITSPFSPCPYCSVLVWTWDLLLPRCLGLPWAGVLHVECTPPSPLSIDLYLSPCANLDWTNNLWLLFLEFPTSFQSDAFSRSIWGFRGRNSLSSFLSCHH